MTVPIKLHQQSRAVYSIQLETGDRTLATLNMVPGNVVYGERLIEAEGKEYRLWDPYRSKLAASILNGLPRMPIKPGCSVLYLGAASGTTVSHVSDIVGTSGRVYAVDFSPRSLRELVNNLSSRINVFPILADVRFPRSYRFLMEKVNVLYCDVAQPQQAKLLADNAELFLRTGGSALIAIKARSIDSTKKPEDIFREEVNRLRNRKLKITAEVPLEPYERDHLIVLAER